MGQKDWKRASSAPPETREIDSSWEELVDDELDDAGDRATAIPDAPMDELAQQLDAEARSRGSVGTPERRYTFGDRLTPPSLGGALQALDALDAPRDEPPRKAERSRPNAAMQQALSSPGVPKFAQFEAVAAQIEAEMAGAAQEPEPPETASGEDEDDGVPAELDETAQYEKAPFEAPFRPPMPSFDEDGVGLADDFDAPGLLADLDLTLPSEPPPPHADEAPQRALSEDSLPVHGVMRPSDMEETLELESPVSTEEFVDPLSLPDSELMEPEAAQPASFPDYDDAPFPSDVPEAVTSEESPTQPGGFHGPESDSLALDPFDVPQASEETSSSGDELDLFDLPEPEPEPEQEVPVFQAMKDRYAMGDFTGALEAAEDILAEAPNDADALRYAQSCRDVLTQMYMARLGPMEQVAAIAVPPDQIRWLSLDHRSGFLLSLVDGASTLEEILDISGMPRLDALRILHALLEQRVISIEA